jgi:hypothetical protein
MAEGSGCIIGFIGFMVVSLFYSVFGRKNTRVNPK